jgi:hypothetical protein
MKYRVETLNDRGDGFDPRDFDEYKDAFAEAQNEAQHKLASVKEEKTYKVSISAFDENDEDAVAETLDVFPYIQTWRVDLNPHSGLWTEWDTYAELTEIEARRPEDAAAEALEWVLDKSTENLELEGCDDEEIEARLYDEWKNLQLKVAANDGGHKDIRTEETYNIKDVVAYDSNYYDIFGRRR